MMSIVNIKQVVVSKNCVKFLFKIIACNSKLDAAQQ